VTTDHVHEHDHPRTDCAHHVIETEGVDVGPEPWATAVCMDCGAMGRAANASAAVEAIAGAGTADHYEVASRGTTHYHNPMTGAYASAERHQYTRRSD
jgi:hypothetical protein